MNRETIVAAGAVRGTAERPAAVGEPRFLVATRESSSRCAQCRAYRRATLEGLHFSVYWCGRCPARLVLTRLDREGGPVGSTTHHVAHHERDSRLHLFETEAGPLVVFLRTGASAPDL